MSKGIGQDCGPVAHTDGCGCELHTALRRFLSNKRQKGAHFWARAVDKRAKEWGIVPGFFFFYPPLPSLSHFLGIPAFQVVRSTLGRRLRLGVVGWGWGESGRKKLLAYFQYGLKHSHQSRVFWVQERSSMHRHVGFSELFVPSQTCTPAELGLNMGFSRGWVYGMGP